MIEVLYVLTAICCGISFGFMDKEGLKTKKLGSIGLFVTVFSLLIGVIAELVLILHQKDASKQLTAGLKILVYVSDVISTMTFSSLYILRCETLTIVYKTFLSERIRYLIILPILYCIANVWSFLYVFDIQDLRTSQQVYSGSNLIQSLFELTTHYHLSRGLTHLKAMTRIPFSDFQLYTPFCGSVLYLISTIWCLIDIQVGHGPIQLAWCIDMLVYQYTTKCIVKTVMTGVPESELDLQSDVGITESVRLKAESRESII
ncbi:hypothetical protein BC833DRAFT_362252 [Globomyces pollinis-pini]|nr:hypothetical protein BC833DRAFT_362252 [Globomyces pollinis-pini]